MRLAWISLLAFSACATSARLVHEQRSHTGLQENRIKLEVLEKDAFVSARIGLVQRNLDRGYEHVMSISDPASPLYGQHWTKSQVQNEFSPGSHTIKVVWEWLTSSGIKNAKLTSDKAWFAFDAPLRVLENLLDTRFFEFEDGDTVRLGCDEYSLPVGVAEHVDYITPGINLSPPLRKRHLNRVKVQSHADKNELSKRLSEADNIDSLKNCGTRITPACYRALYGFPEPGSIELASGNLGIFAPGWCRYSESDLDGFFSELTNIPNGTRPDFVAINRAKPPARNAFGCVEADLDLMVAYGLLGAVNMTFFEAGTTDAYTPDKPTDKYYNNDYQIIPLLDAVDGSFCSVTEKDNFGFQCGGIELSQVLSVSYGGPELFAFTAKKQKRVCNELMKLALQGHTVLISSGDFGVSTSSNYNIVDPANSNGCVPQDLDNTGKNKFNGTIFVPDFPANCPYVLAVGATMLYPGQTVNDPESVMYLPPKPDNTWSNFVRFSSGGGFSNYFSRPAYQDKAVSSWFAKHDPGYNSYTSNGIDVQDKDTNIGANGGVYNRAGRAFPDVSANGYHFRQYLGDGFYNNDGTSVATPAWASIIALLNAERAKLGKKQVGFVNPVLYQHPEVFHDIRNGTNGPGCGTDGFAAVEGWDPVTGLGTPRWEALKELFCGLP